MQHDVRLAGITAQLVWHEPLLLVAPLAAGLLSVAIIYATLSGLFALGGSVLAPGVFALEWLACVAASLGALGITWTLAKAASVVFMGRSDTSGALRPSSMLATTTSRAPALVRWALAEWLVGPIVRSLEIPGLLGLPGRLLTRPLGMAWSAAALSAIPVAIYDSPPKRSALSVLGRSAGLLRDRYGPGLAATGTLRSLSSLGILVAMVLSLGAFALTGSLPLALGVVAACALAILAARSLAGAAYSYALYSVLTTGAPALGMDPDDLAAGLRPRLTRVEPGPPSAFPPGT